MSDTAKVSTVFGGFVTSGYSPRLAGARRRRAILPNHWLPSMRAAGQRALVPFLLLLLWQGGSIFGYIPARTFAPPTQVAAAFWRLVVSGELEQHLLVSLGRAAAGLTLGIIIGGSLALLAGLSKRGENLVDPTVQMLRTLPFLALVPLFILWFGIGETPKIALVAVGTSFPIYMTLFSGIRAVDPKLIELARTLGLGTKDQLRQIVLPGALPPALVGLRYACGISWLSLVVAEQINAQSGIGYLIMNARDFMATDVIVVGLLVYALLGLASDRLVRLFERKALSWRPSFVEP